ncbi:MAG: GntR family transcriptional regulator [Cellulomonadaceae bacterium]|nr:GntR family transcriptional regulator [Cellulomonadaceae bacterium]
MENSREHWYREQTVWTGLRDSFREKILDRTWETYVPPVNELKEEYHVGVSAVRQALNDLAREGLIIIAHGKRTRIIREVDMRNLAHFTRRIRSIEDQARALADEFEAFLGRQVTPQRENQ